MASRVFHVVLIKPSHYHDDGYVIRWWRGLVPSNSLAALHGVALDCSERRVLGPDVDIEIDVIDETNTRVNVPKLLRRFRKADRFGIVGLIGVQTNQYPRALDIARPFRQDGIPVVIGGFHVSGCIAMLDGTAVDLDRARELGVSIFAGEAEGRFEMLLRDTADGGLKPQYDFTERSRRHGGSAKSVPADRVCEADGRDKQQLRFRARLPVSVFILHDHQRAGPKIAVAHARRRREGGSRELAGRHFPLLPDRR